MGNWMEEPFPPLSAKIHSGMKEKKKSNKINGHTQTHNFYFLPFNLAFPLAESRKKRVRVCV